MEPLRQSIHTLFRRQNPMSLLEKYLHNSGKLPIEEPGMKHFQFLYREDNPSFTLDQIETVYNVLLNEWMTADPKDREMNYFAGTSVFNALLHFTNITLLEHTHGPICQYRHLLRWHELSQQVSEDMLTLAFLAARDSRVGFDGRDNFEWPAVIAHDNAKLNQMMHDKHVSELHAHLKGSSQTFALSWISLMNDIEGRDKVFKEYEYYQSPYIGVGHSKECKIYDAVKMAAIIRLYLFERVRNRREHADLRIEQDLTNLVANDSDFMLPLDLQDRINACKGTYGKSYKIKDRHLVLDYAIPQSADTTIMSVLSGERRFIYDVFRYLIDEGREDKDVEMLLYIYLVVKLKLRGEMIQNNRFVGFANFSIYEGRKTDFLNAEFKQLSLAMAVRPFCDVNRERRYFEARSVPKESLKDLVKDIKSMEGAIQELLIDDLLPVEKGLKDRRYDCWYIMHFIKKPDNKANLKSMMICRHATNRAKYERQAKAIYDFRAGADQRNLIVGIDAANSEIFCRPEVFAQVFRYLRKQRIRPDMLSRAGIKVPEIIGVTYHVGEDFMDIADGLRAVDEAFHFFGLYNGDRIGHGLVLGTDVRAYYEKRGMMLTFKRQDWLDNIAWLYHHCGKLDCSLKILGWLRVRYNEIYREIFEDEIEGQKVVDIDTYYRSWLLRGDNPEIYLGEMDGAFLDSKIEPLTPWEREALNDDKDAKVARKSKTARTLYRAYHYDPKVKQNGDCSVSVKVTDEYVEAVMAIQQLMLDRMQNYHIAIECNPTSNYRIGEFSKYSSHPLLKFFNCGLDTDYPSHAVPISINTDDSGVFATTVEREYALIALSLEKDRDFISRNSPHAIYGWLNSIREMSHEQRFHKDYYDGN